MKKYIKYMMVLPMMALLAGCSDSQEIRCDNEEALSLLKNKFIHQISLESTLEYAQSLVYQIDNTTLINENEDKKALLCQVQMSITNESTGESGQVTAIYSIEKNDDKNLVVDLFNG